MNRTTHSRARSPKRWGIILLILSLWLTACADATSSSSRAGCAATPSLTGAGSTFDAPLFNKLFTVYPTVSCGLTVNYYPVGSGAGAAQLLNQQADFGATDAPLTDRQLAASPNGAILHIPVTLGVVAISYHLASVSSPLRLSGEVVANIYLGQVTAWDDPTIVQLNPGVSLPQRPIQVLHRSDGSGTTAIFTHYLAAVSPAWKTKVGAGGTSVTWPVGTGEQGSLGVTDQLASTEGSIGYVKWSYVVQKHLSAALIQNAKGTYLAPSIAGYSWVIVYQKQNDAEHGKALAQLLWWMIHNGQQYAEPLQYAPLPTEIVTKGEAQIRAMSCGTSSTPCLTK